MKIITAGRGVAALIVPTSATCVLISCSADHLTNAPESVRFPTPVPTLSAASAGEQQSDGHAPTQKDADGNAFQLPYDGSLSVFIDGPTGYAFTRTSDTGWRFVGHITDQNR